MYEDILFLFKIPFYSWLNSVNLEEYWEFVLPMMKFYLVMPTIFIVLCYYDF